MDAKQLNELQRSVDTLTERSLNAATLNEHIQKQNEALSLKLDVILSQIAQNNLDNREEHFTLKVSFKNKINSAVENLNTTIEGLRKQHDKDMEIIRNNLMYRLGRQRTVVAVIGIIILIAFWQNVEGIVTKIAKDHGIDKTKPTTLIDERRLIK